ncbi:MAG TPA: SOS response-associated peptidase [Limnochordia bacterium]|nr:SOS response-associated peptidase [Limnochordia bacterium]HPZ30776.1 SOS response-associated peptidase [Limnochordia bacterium]HXK98294.1 SOS response-associated peptidase [Limnochordia bacterium]
MCGRFTLTSDMDLIMYRFAAVMLADLTYLPRYNIAPTQPVLAVVNEGGGRIIREFRWGLIPFWAKDERIGVKMINARSETLADKPSFKNLLKRRRCLIPATGFYEWMRTEKTKQPVYIKLKSEPLFAFAGLWDEWRSPSGVVQTCTIITTEANTLIQPVHHRMPAILTPKQEQLWLDPDLEDQNALLPLLKPFPSDEMEMHRVSPLVNSPRNDAPECIMPIG